MWQQNHFLVSFYYIFMEIKSNYALRMFKIKTIKCNFSPFDFLVIYLSLWSFVDFFSNLTFTWYLYFLYNYFKFDQKITCCLLISTFLRKYEYLGTLRSHTTPFWYTCYFFYMYFNYFYTLNSHSYHSPYAIYIYIYENL